jgi:enoyl-[acyl-carrier protein] reductase I
MSNNLLKGKRGIVFGALNNRSIAWKAAERIKEEGGVFVLSNSLLALRQGELNDLAKACDNAPVIPADVTIVSDLENLVSESVRLLGGKMDFVLHSVAMSNNIRKGKSYGDLDYSFFFKNA